MTKRKCALCLCAVMVLLVSSFDSQMQLIAAGERYEHLYQISATNDEITNRYVKDLVDTRNRDGKKTPLYTAWSQRENVRLENRELQRTWQGNVLFYNGDNEGIFAVIADDGCSLTKEAAYKLFGTEDILGETVRIDEKKYVVERLTADDSAVIVRSGKGAAATTSAGFVYDRLNCNLKGVGGADSLKAKAMISGQFPAGLVIDYDLLLRMLQSIRLLPIWSLVAWAAFLLLRYAVKSRKQFAKMVLFVVAAVLICCLGERILGTPFAFPDSFIPTQWSDFGFWEQTWLHTKKVIVDFLTMRQALPDLPLRLAMIRIGVHCLIQTVLLLVLVKEVWSYVRNRIQRDWQDLWKRCGRGGTFYFRNSRRRIRRIGRTFRLRKIDGTADDRRS